MPPRNATAETKLTQPAVDWHRDVQTASAPVFYQYATTLALAAGATVIAAGFDQGVAIPNLSLIYVLPVIAAAVMFGLGPSLFAAILGALAYNYFFTAPRFSLAVDDPANIWAIVLLFLTGCAASGVASAGRRRSNDAKLLEIRQALICGYSNALVDERNVIDALDATADLLRSIYKAPVAVVLIAHDGTQQSALRDLDTLGTAEMEAILSAIASGEKVIGGVFPNDQSRLDLWPIKVAGRTSVVIGLAFDGNDRPEGIDDMLGPVSALLALWLSARSC